MYLKLADLIQKIFKIDAHYFLKGGFWLTLGQFFTLVFGLASTVLFAHYLSETDFGTYKYLLGLTSIFSVFSLTGLGQAILQTTAKGFHSFYKETITINFKYNLGISAISLIFSSYYYINENITLSLGCATIAILQPVINTYKYLPNYLFGAKQFKQFTKITSMRTIFVTIVSIVTLLITKDILILFIIYLSSNIIINLVSQVFYKPGPLVTPQDILTKYITYAKHTSVRNIIVNIAYRLDTIIIFTQLGAVDLAVYTIANIIPEQVKGLFKNITSLLLPKYSEQENKDKIKKSIPKRSLQLFILLLSISFLYIILSPFLYNLLFPKYENAIFLSQLIALSFPAIIVVLPNSFLQSKRKERELYLSNIQSSIVLVALTLILIPSYGLLGAIIAKILSRYSNVLISFHHLNKINN